MSDNSKNDDIDFLLSAWVHLTPFQKKIIAWRVFLLSIRERAFRFVLKLTGGESNE